MPISSKIRPGSAAPSADPAPAEAASAAMKMAAILNARMFRSPVRAPGYPSAVRLPSPSRLCLAAPQRLEGGHVRHPFARYRDQPRQPGAEPDEAADGAEAEGDEGRRSDRHADRLHRALGPAARSAL